MTLPADVVGSALSDDRAMRVALELARQGMGKVSPNPMVGAVLLDAQGVCLATGYHARLGGPHAEAHLLDQITDLSRLKGGRLFVTLEPCSHEGRTPSCAVRLSSLPLKEVIFGSKDVSKVAGGGAQILQQAGISPRLYQGPLKPDLDQLNEVFLYATESSSAFVALKVGATLDGKMAIAQTGHSQWITGAASREKAHELRVLYDATLIGEGTLLKDDPSLNVRHPDHPGHINKVVVLAQSTRAWEFLQRSKLLSTHAPENIYWVGPVTEGGAPVQKLQPQLLKGTQEIDLSHLKKMLLAAGLQSVLVEGGSFTLSHFLSQKAAQRLHLFLAPKVMGGEGLDWAGGFVTKDLPSLQQVSGGKWQTVGEDAYFTGRL